MKLLCLMPAAIGLSGALSAAIPPAAAAEQELESLIVTATRLPRSPEEIAGTVSVIDSVELENRVAADLDDIARYQPGIGMDTSARGGNQGFVIRGIGGNRVLTLIDGVRGNDRYNAVVSGYGKDVFEIDDLKSVEIIRGPASVLYGADALGGVVLLRTKAPRDYLEEGETVHLGVRAAGNGASDEYKLGLSAAAQGALFQYTAREFGERDVSGPGRQNPLDGRSDNVLVKALFGGGNAQELELTADYYDENVESRLDSELGDTVFDSRGDDRTERRRMQLEHRWQTAALPADGMTTQLYWQRTDALQHTEQTRISYSFIDPADPSTASSVSTWCPSRRTTSRPTWD